MNSAILNSDRTGPAKMVPAITLPLITRVDIQIARQIIIVEFGINQRIELDYSQVFTLTDIISGVTSTFTIGASD